MWHTIRLNEAESLLVPSKGDAGRFSGHLGVCQGQGGSTTGTLAAKAAAAALGFLLFATSDLLSTVLAFPLIIHLEAKGTSKVE